MEGAILRGKERPIVKYRDTLWSSVQKKAEPIAMQFGLWARIGRWNYVLDGSPEVLREGRCHGNHFLAFDGLYFWLYDSYRHAV